MVRFLALFWSHRTAYLPYLPKTVKRVQTEVFGVLNAKFSCCLRVSHKTFKLELCPRLTEAKAAKLLFQTNPGALPVSSCQTPERLPTAGELTARAHFLSYAK